MDQVPGQCGSNDGPAGAISRYLSPTEERRQTDRAPVYRVERMLVSDVAIWSSL